MYQYNYVYIFTVYFIYLHASPNIICLYFLYNLYDIFVSEYPNIAVCMTRMFVLSTIYFVHHYVPNTFVCTQLTFVYLFSTNWRYQRGSEKMFVCLFGGVELHFQQYFFFSNEFIISYTATHKSPMMWGDNLILHIKDVI